MKTQEASDLAVYLCGDVLYRRHVFCTRSACSVLLKLSLSRALQSLVDPSFVVNPVYGLVWQISNEFLGRLL